VIVTEYGVADLRELTSGEKALALASIAHPKFRDEFLQGVVDDPLFTKPIGLSLDRPPRGVSLYEGRISLEG
jgi:4-hydroxybutyrate CoA-transferase